MLEADNIWDSLSIKPKEEALIVSDINTGYLPAEGGLIASANISETTTNPEDEATLNFMKSAWTFDSLTEKTDGELDILNNPNLNLSFDERFVEYKTLSQKMNSEEAVRANYANENGEVDVNALSADFNRYEELNSKFSTNLDDISVDLSTLKGGEAAKAEFETRVSETSAIANSERETIGEVTKVFFEDMSEVTSNKRDELIEQKQV